MVVWVYGWCKTEMVRDVQRPQAREAALSGDSEQLARRMCFNHLSHCTDMIRRGAATAADDIEKTAAGPLIDLARHLLRPQLILAKLIGQSGIGVGRDRALRVAGIE